MAEYLVDLNASQAALRAGYKTSHAHKMGSELLGKRGIAEAIAAGKAAQLAKAGITAERVLEEARRLALSDVRALFDDKGRMKPVKEWPDELAAAIGGVEVVRRNVDSADGHTDDVIKVKVWDKPKNLEMLFKHLGLLAERLEHSGSVTFKWEGE